MLSSTFYLSFTRSGAVFFRRDNETSISAFARRSSAEPLLSTLSVSLLLLSSAFAVASLAAIRHPLIFVSLHGRPPSARIMEPGSEEKHDRSLPFRRVCLRFLCTGCLRRQARLIHGTSVAFFVPLFLVAMPDERVCLSFAGTASKEAVKGTEGRIEEQGRLKMRKK